MKQRITLEQLKELSSRGRDNYAKYITKIPNADFKFLENLAKHDHWNLMNIGQMIEFLDEKGMWSILKVSKWHGGGYVVVYGIVPTELTETAMSKSVIEKQENELCDALWIVVKSILEDEKMD